jgi:dihydroxyacetone kinase
MVVVGDDVSVEGNSLVGQRGLAGVVFVHKVSGAKAAKGYVMTSKQLLA